MTRDRKEIVSALIHLIGAILGAVGMILLLYTSFQKSSIVGIISFLIFGISMILLYSSSTIYHFIDTSKEKAKLVMRKIDHMMIFVLIAGTYSPVCIMVLDKSVGYKLLAIVWSITIIGFLVKIFWMNAPRWVSTGLYIAMGWLAVSVLSPLVKTMDTGGIFWLVLGGVIYTVGGVIYALKKPNIFKRWFGFHELFHIFVLAGTLCHFLMMYFYIA